MHAQHHAGMLNGGAGILRSGFTFSVCLYLASSAGNATAVATGLAASFILLVSINDRGYYKGGWW